MLSHHEAHEGFGVRAGFRPAAYNNFVFFAFFVVKFSFLLLITTLPYQVTMK